MATELDKLIVKIQADISDLQKGLAKAKTSVDGASKKMSNGFDKANKSLNNFSKTAFKVGAVIGTAIGVTAVKGVVDVAVEIENLQVRLKALFGSATEGAKAFEEMTKFASQVPFSLAEIQRGSGSLAVVSDDAEHLGKLLEITGNVASVTGLSFQATAEQIQRSFAGGIASADMFREKGVRQMLGFEMGTKVSIEETADAFERVFGKGGKFGNASEELAKTFTGTVSMIGDKFFNIQKRVGEGFFEDMKGQFNTFNKSLEENRHLLMAYADIIGQKLSGAFKSVGGVMSAITTTLKGIFSLMVATFAVNTVVFFTTAIIGLNKALKTTELTLKSINVLTGGLGQLLAKVIGGVLIFMGLEKALDNLAKRAEANAEQLKKNEEFVKILEERYDLANGTFKQNAEVMSEQKKKAMELAEFNKKLDNIMAEVDTTFKEAGKSISDAFADSIVKGKSFKDAMKQIFQDVSAQIVSTVLQIMVIGPLIEKLNEALRDMRANMQSVGGFGLDNMLTNAMLAGVNPQPSGIPGMPPMANGGIVAPNRPYMVGEKGVEMFVPRTAGNIIPNSQMGGSVVINQSLNFSTGVVPTVRAEVMNLMPQIKKETVGAVAEARTRGGAFARTFGA